MELSQLLKTTPETLATQQYDALKAHALNVIEDIFKRLRSDDIKGIRNRLYYSPSGDGHGCDSHCIDFSYDKSLYTADFGELLDKLESLNNIALGNKKG